jgi:hypothetical protein
VAAPPRDRTRQRLISEVKDQGMLDNSEQETRYHKREPAREDGMGWRHLVNGWSLPIFVLESAIRQKLSSCLAD